MDPTSGQAIGQTDVRGQVHELESGLAIFAYGRGIGRARVS
ncbi:MAG: hypothetical protein ACK5LN_05210 [Propioniciclava sp.]